MEASELKRIAGKVVGEKDQSARRMRVYGWPVLIALAQHYLDTSPNGESRNLAEVDVEAIRARGGDVERVAGGLTAAGLVKFGDGTEEPRVPPPASGAPLAGGGNDQTAEDMTKAKPLADKLSQAQFIALQAANRNEEMSGHHEAVIQALVRKELLDADLRVTALGRLVDGLAETIKRMAEYAESETMAEKHGRRT